ncbi:hypothetical protein [Kamptonema formosum]|nr:hypothetical protein [Kamptonema formosum]
MTFFISKQRRSTTRDRTDRHIALALAVWGKSRISIEIHCFFSCVKFL